MEFREVETREYCYLQHRILGGGRKKGFYLTTPVIPLTQNLSSSSPLDIQKDIQQVPANNQSL